MATQSAATEPVPEPKEVEKEKTRLGLERMIFFSDAVFAIAITLLALEIRLPDVARGFNNTLLFSTLVNMWPQYFGYAISFLVIGSFWLAHHRKFRYIIRLDNRLLQLNLLLLMAVAFVPFPSSVISVSGNRTATIFYALVMILASFIFVALWRYALRHGMVDPQLTERQRKRETILPLIMSGLFALTIGVALLDPGVARLLWLLILPVSVIFRPS